MTNSEKQCLPCSPPPRKCSPRVRLKEVSAIFMLLAGNVLVYIDFFTPPQGEVSPTALYYFAQCLIYAGAVFGISAYVDGKVDKVMDERFGR